MNEKGRSSELDESEILQITQKVADCLYRIPTTNQQLFQSENQTPSTNVKESKAAKSDNQKVSETVVDYPLKKPETVIKKQKSVKKPLSSEEASKPVESSKQEEQQKEPNDTPSDTQLHSTIEGDTSLVRWHITAEATPKQVQSKPGRWRIGTKAAKTAPGVAVKETELHNLENQSSSSKIDTSQQQSNVNIQTASSNKKDDKPINTVNTNPGRSVGFEKTKVQPETNLFANDKVISNPFDDKAWFNAKKKIGSKQASNEAKNSINTKQTSASPLFPEETTTNTPKKPNADEILNELASVLGYDLIEKVHQSKEKGNASNVNAEALLVAIENERKAYAELKKSLESAVNNVEKIRNGLQSDLKQLESTHNPEEDLREELKSLWNEYLAEVQKSQNAVTSEEKTRRTEIMEPCNCYNCRRNGEDHGLVGTGRFTTESYTVETPDTERRKKAAAKAMALKEEHKRRSDIYNKQQQNIPQQQIDEQLQNIRQIDENKFILHAIENSYRTANYDPNLDATIDEKNIIENDAEIKSINQKMKQLQMEIGILSNRNTSIANSLNGEVSALKQAYLEQQELSKTAEMQTGTREEKEYQYEDCSCYSCRRGEGTCGPQITGYTSTSVPVYGPDEKARANAAKESERLKSLYDQKKSVLAQKIHEGQQENNKQISKKKSAQQQLLNKKISILSSMQIDKQESKHEGFSVAEVQKLVAEPQKGKQCEADCANLKKASNKFIPIAKIYCDDDAADALKASYEKFVLAQVKTQQALGVSQSQVSEFNKTM